MQVQTSCDSPKQLGKKNNNNKPKEALQCRQEEKMSGHPRKLFNHWCFCNEVILLFLSSVDLRRNSQKHKTDERFILTSFWQKVGF